MLSREPKLWTFFWGSTLLSIVKTSFSLFPPYFRDLELGVLEDIFLPCGSRKEREAAAKDTTKEEDEAKAIVSKEETSEKSTTTEGAKKKNKLSKGRRQLSGKR